MFGIDRFHIGSTEDREAITGCTVMLFDGGAVSSVDIRGASPGTRETALLAPDKQMNRVDAILFTGGSAYGLAAATGVVKFLAERGIGYTTPWRVVPIVPGAVIFDLNIGRSDAFPDDRMGYRACEAAIDDRFSKGSHGAGTGATVGKWAGLNHAMKSGQGVGLASKDKVKVAAVAVVNAVGDVYDLSGSFVAGAQVEGKPVSDNTKEVERIVRSQLPGANTTLVSVVTNANLSKTELNRIAQRCHDSLARRIVPVHTSYDGDAVFASSTCEIEAQFELVAALASDAVSGAILEGVMSAEPLGSFVSYSDLHHEK